MMTVLKVTFSPQLESEKLIPNKNTQENSGKKKKHTEQKDMNNLFKKEKKNKQTNKQKMSLMYLNSCSILLILTEN